MASFYVFMVTTSCPECGGPLLLDGPALRVTCRACRSTVEIPAREWETALSFPRQAHLDLEEGQLHTSATLGPEFSFRVRWGPQRPLCRCGARVDLARWPIGSDGEIPCACGRTVTTFPAPAWLKDVTLDALQIWGAARESAPAPAPEASRDPAKPVSFSCPECGANLKVTSESTRLLECSYCKSDLYLPDGLWFAIHPVRTRQRWYVAFDD